MLKVLSNILCDLDPKVKVIGQKAGICDGVPSNFALVLFVLILYIPSTMFQLGLNEIYVWFLLPTYPNFFNPTLNIKMVFGEKIPKMGTFSDFVTVFFVKCYNKI